MGNSSNGREELSGIPVGQDSGCSVSAGQSHTHKCESGGEPGRSVPADAEGAGDQSASNQSAGAAANAAKSPDPITAALTEALEAANIELDAARIAYLEAKAAAKAAEHNANRLQAAVAALTGQTAHSSFTDDQQPASESAEQTSEPRPKKKKKQDNNPMAHIKCAGCGAKGKMHESIIQAPSGAHVRMLVCGDCGNQSF